MKPLIAVWGSKEKGHEFNDGEVWHLTQTCKPKLKIIIYLFNKSITDKVLVSQDCTFVLFSTKDCVGAL